MIPLDKTHILVHVHMLCQEVMWITFWQQKINLGTFLFSNYIIFIIVFLGILKVISTILNGSKWNPCFIKYLLY